MLIRPLKDERWVFYEVGTEYLLSRVDEFRLQSAQQKNYDYLPSNITPLLHLTLLHVSAMLNTVKLLYWMVDIRNFSIQYLHKGIMFTKFFKLHVSSWSIKNP